MVERDLWAGADVRWVGPETVRRGLQLRPGDRAVVIRAERHQVSSFAAVYHPAGNRPSRSSRGVTIRLAEGGEVVVPRKHLEILPPNHPLAPEPDGTHAAWWLDQLEPWGQRGPTVRSLVPSNLPAVCQVLHPWLGPGPVPIRWRELAEQHGFSSIRGLDQTRQSATIPFAEQAGLRASAGELDHLTAGALVDVLAGHTATPGEVFVAVWNGWGDVPVQRFPNSAHLETGTRGHFLLRGPLTGVLVSVAASGIDRPAAGLWWPADRAWFVATDIDFEWTFVAGSNDLVHALVADERLEVGRTSPDAPANRVAEPG